MSPRRARTERAKQTTYAPVTLASSYLEQLLLIPQSIPLAEFADRFEALSEVERSEELYFARVLYRKNRRLRRSLIAATPQDLRDAGESSVALAVEPSRLQSRFQRQLVHLRRVYDSAVRAAEGASISLARRRCAPCDHRTP
jgi:ABC-type microcin C transport system duplicated ATPase subunit YejF